MRGAESMRLTLAAAVAVAAALAVAAPDASPVAARRATGAHARDREARSPAGRPST